MPGYEKYTQLLVKKENNIAVVTFNNPDIMNPISGQLHDDLEAIWEDLANDKEVRVVILTGAGRAFSAGGNLNNMKKRIMEGLQAQLIDDDLQGARKLIRNMLDFVKPVISAINGPAMGLGASVALASDISIAVEGARIADTHVKAALAAGDGGIVFWPLMTSMAKAKLYLLTGRALDGREAERIGLISMAVPAEQLWPTVMSVAQELANGAPFAINYTKIAMNRILKERMMQVLDASLALEFLNMYTKDHLEGINAFLEKRSPRFNGT